jgi:hypothetical protein
MGLFTNFFSSIGLTQSSGKKEVVYLLGDARYDLQITGEENYQVALEELCGPRHPKGVQQFETAWLVVDEQNDSNKKAVRVEIRGKLVGYLDRDATVRYRRYLNARGTPKAWGQCQAVIRGGWLSSDGRKGPYYVALDIPELAP